MRKSGGEVATYRRENGGPESYVYSIGANGERLTGLMAVSTETRQPGAGELR